MAPKTDGDAYYPCLRCGCLIPQYVEEIHATECHVLKKRAFTHPLISGLSLICQALIIGGRHIPTKKDASKLKKSKQNEGKEKVNSKMKGSDEREERKKTPPSNVNQDEPEWLKKILPAFHYRIVVISELDMIRCKITAYTPVLLEHEGHCCAFIAVPDQEIRIGHVILHNIGCAQYLPSVVPKTVVRIKKINDVRIAEEIVLFPSKPFSEEDCTGMQHHIKNMMLSSYPLGAPFTIKTNSIVHPYASEMTSNQYFTVARCVSSKEPSCTGIEDSILVTNMERLCIEEDDNEKIISQVSDTNLTPVTNANDLVDPAIDTNASVDESSLLFQGTECTQDACPEGYITIDEYNEGDSLNGMKAGKKNFLTSTPNKVCSNTSNLYKSLLSSKFSGNYSTVTVGKDISAIDRSVKKKDVWFRIGKNTNVTIKLPKMKTVTESAMKEIYCKDNVYIALKKIVQNKLKNSDTSGNPFLCGWNGVLLYGPPGTGKSLLVHEVAHAMKIPLVSLSLADVIESSGAGSECVRSKFREAIERSPSVLFIDEVDSLCPIGEHRVARDKDLTKAVINGFQILKTATNMVLVIAATSRIEGVSSKVRCAGRFDKEFLIPLPTAQQRSQILLNLLSTHRHNLSQDSIECLAKQAYGFSGADLNMLLKCAWFRCVQRVKENNERNENIVLGEEDLQIGMSQVVPTMLREDFQAISMVRWNDIWGYAALKSKLQKMIHLHNSEPETHPLRGVLLYGPPGCSKTMFVKALVKETSYSFFPLKCSDLLSKYVGETEKSLSKLFQCAWQAAPSIIFMDEVDSLCGDRSQGSGLVSELLSLMTETTLRGNILVIGATNRPHALDEALLKPGCLEQVIHVDLPDFECRSEMWTNLLKDVPCNGKVNIEKLSEVSAGSSGAEITGMYQHAAQAVLAEMTEKQGICSQDNKISDVEISEALLLKSIAALPPRTPESLLAKIKDFTRYRSSSSGR